MSLNFLFVMDPLAGIDPSKDTTFVFMLESLARGHRVYCAGVSDLHVRAGSPFARCQPATVQRQHPHFDVSDAEDHPLSHFAAVFMRKDPPVDQAYLFATYILSLADPQRTLVLNNPAALRDANEKVFALHFPDLVPETIVTSDINHLRTFLKQQGGRMIIKPLDGCGGSGVFLIEAGDRNTASLLDLSTEGGRRLIMAQSYLEAVRAGDKRIILLDGAPLGAVLRVPASDDHRGNIHVGGTCRIAPLTPRDIHICSRLGPALHDRGLIFVGIDVIGDYLTEINVTSPTGVQEINALNNVHLETEVIRWVERHVPLPAA